MKDMGNGKTRYRGTFVSVDLSPPNRPPAVALATEDEGDHKQAIAALIAQILAPVWRIIAVATVWLLCAIAVQAGPQTRRVAVALALSNAPEMVPETRQEQHYEWRLTPGNQQALMLNGVQIGNWIAGDGYYPKLGENKWGPKTLPPIDPPERPTGHGTGFGRQVGQAATPFAWPLPSAGEAADGNIEGNGPLPLGFDLPAGMKRYRRASYTQEIAVTDGRDRISPVHRLQVKEKWHASGGFADMGGFRSDLYRNDARPRVWVGNIGVLNSLGYMQDNRGWKREYPDGARFLDVLSKDGTVFEVRSAEKKDGKWNRLVVYRDKEARPKGYDRLAVSCASCHDEAGSGGYATGLVPGGDGIISDPFPALENP